MVKKILVFLLLMVWGSNVFSIQCPDDEKLIKVDGNVLGYNMYNKVLYTNELQECSARINCDLFTGGEWALKSYESDNFSLVGQSLCLGTEAYSKTANTIGSNCFCKISELDNYKVLSDWVNVKLFQSNVFDEYKKYSSESAKKYAKESVDKSNIRDCMNSCSRVCKSYLSNLIRTVRGYYICDKALYKVTNVRCGIDNKIVRANTIFVFDDGAEINMDNDSIIFGRDKTNTQELTYVGEFEYDTVYLKVKDNKIYVGNKIYSLAECL